MTKIIAKNLLEGKTCQNCEYKRNNYCENPYLSNTLAESNTCSGWEKKSHKTFNVKWTKESEVVFHELNGLDVEEELIKAVSEEIRKTINDEITMKIKDIKFGE